MSCRTNCKTFVLVLALAVLAVPAFGQANNCLQDEYTASGGGSLTCTANDVQLAAVKNVQVIGGVGNKCLAGTKFSFLADFEVVTTSNKTRSNIGIYFGTGQANAVSGTCSDAIISPPHACPADSALTCGSDHYDEFDPSPDNCGDTSSQDTSTTYPGVAGAQGVVLEVDNVTCPTSGTTLALPECTSWQVPGKQLFCESPAPNYPYQPSAVPGSPSKCVCGVLSVPVQPIQPAATVAKTCNIGSDTTPGLTSCDAGAEGNSVTYTVTITNTTPAGEGGIVVDQVCDNRYGNVFTATGFTGPACLGGTVGTVSSTTCNAATPGTIANGTSGSCTFTVAHGENLSVTDTATVTGHSALSSASTFGPDSSNTVTVTSEDAPTTAKTTKGLAPGPIAACVTLRFNATVTNTSAADESVTISSATGIPALNDSFFGDVTTDHGSASVSGSVTGTTCGVATGSAGQGTLSGSTGAGVFPATLNPGSGTPPITNGGTYSCQFDGVICGTPGPITGCAEGLQNVDTVTAHLTGDDPSPNADAITETETPFTADICFVQSGQ